MLCPHCHAENNYDALTCDFCMHELPMTEEEKQLLAEKVASLSATYDALELR